MNATFDAWYLPALGTADFTITSYQLGTLTVHAPLLEREQIDTIITRLIAARDRYLVRATTSEIISAISRAAERIGDPSSPEGAAARELLPAVTGYSVETIEEVLAHMTYDWSAASLQLLLRAELGDPALLERPLRDPHTERLVLARGPRFAFHVFSGNVPGIAVTSIVRALLVKAASLGKTASGEPVLPVLFMRALAATSPTLAECVAVTYWPGGSHDIEAAALHAADAVIVYGGEEAAAVLGARTPVGTRLIVHGPKLSIGIVGRAADASTAHAIARATAAYDQQGCVSPHVVYVETGGALQPKELARAVARALAELAVRQPRRAVTHAEAVAIRNARTEVEFRGIAGADAEVFGSEDTSYTVIYDEDVTLTASCLNRLLYIKPIESAGLVPALLRPQRALMQSVALAGFSAVDIATLTPALADSGVTRITNFEALPWPPMWWHHDGRGPLQELLFWHDVEP